MEEGGEYGGCGGVWVLDVVRMWGRAGEESRNEGVMVRKGTFRISRFTRACDVQIVIPLRRLDEDSETQTCTDAREHQEGEGEDEK